MSDLKSPRKPLPPAAGATTDSKPATSVRADGAAKPPKPPRKRRPPFVL